MAKNGHTNPSTSKNPMGSGKGGSSTGSSAARKSSSSGGTSNTIAQSASDSAKLKDPTV